MYTAASYIDMAKDLESNFANVTDSIPTHSSRKHEEDLMSKSNVLRRIKQPLTAAKRGLINFMKGNRASPMGWLRKKVGKNPKESHIASTDSTKDMKTDDPAMSVLVTGQQTLPMQNRLQEIIQDDSNVLMKTSFPRFNSVPLLRPPFSNNIAQRYMADTVIDINAPFYTGRQYQESAGFFDFPFVRDAASILEYQLPAKVISGILQKKSQKLLAAMATAQELAYDENKPQFPISNIDAIKSVEVFTRNYMKLTNDDMPNIPTFYAFVDNHVIESRKNGQWMQYQHFDTVLSNFGVDENFESAFTDLDVIYSEKTGSFEIQDGPDEANADIKKMRFDGIRWLAKIMGFGYGLDGCVTDVGNCVTAMQIDFDPSNGINEEDSFKHLSDLTDRFRKVEKGITDFSDLWIPTHLIMDAELDDDLTWILLKAIAWQQETTLHTYVQLPTNSSLDCAADWYRARGCHVFRDPDSGNWPVLLKKFKNNCTGWL
jgi:hypothetical protein